MSVRISFIAPPAQMCHNAQKARRNASGLSYRLVRSDSYLVAAALDFAVS